MRATDLGFRSPKEKTPGPYQPVKTFDGKELFDSVPHSQTPTFSKEKRFQQYTQEAQRTGMRVGPGSYNVEKPLAAAGPVPYRALHGGVDTSTNGYYMVGNHLVYEQGYVLPGYRNRNPVKELDSPPDPYLVMRSLTPTRLPSAKQRMKVDYTPYTPSSQSSAQDLRLTPEKIYGAYKARIMRTPLGGANLDKRIDHLLSLKSAFV